MSSLGGSSGGLIEKLEHSMVVDLLQIAVYAYFGYVAYTNMGFGDSIFQVPPGGLNVAAVQLAGVLVVINVLFLLHDKVSGGGGIH